MEKYGVSREEIEKMVESGEAVDEQEALEKVASGQKAKKSKTKEEKNATRSKQTPRER